MAEVTVSKPAAGEVPAAPTGVGRRANLVIALVFLMLVVFVECGVALMVLPSANDIAELAQAQLAVDADNAEDAQGLLPDGEASVGEIEVSMGEYSVSSYQPLSNSTLRIDFQLYATVLERDADYLQEMLDANQHRVREQVIVILRGAELTDLTDAGLGLIKRRILEKTNRTIGRAVIQEVVFSDFSFVEQ